MYFNSQLYLKIQKQNCKYLCNYIIKVHSVVYNMGCFPERRGKLKMKESSFFFTIVRTKSTNLFNIKRKQAISCEYRIHDCMLQFFTLTIED